MVVTPQSYTPFRTEEGGLQYLIGLLAATSGVGPGSEPPLLNWVPTLSGRGPVSLYFSPTPGDALRMGLTGGGNRIRTISPAEKETAVERGPAADHRRLARRPCLMTPSSLSARHLSSATAERPFTRAGPMVRIRFPPAESQANFRPRRVRTLQR